jgi:hypothetical protein
MKHTKKNDATVIQATVASLSCVQTTRARARARGRGSFVCGRGHESRYKPHKPHEPRARVAPNAVGTSKGGSQACKGR